MVEFSDYSEFAKHNETVSEKIAIDCKAWSAIILFYAALNWVNFYCSRKFSNLELPNTHWSRLEFIKQKINPIYKDYNNLYKFSQLYRYHLPNWKHITEEDSKRINTAYESIKVYINTH